LKKLEIVEENTVKKQLKSVQQLDNFGTYEEFLANLKSRIGQSQTRAAFAVSHELILLYWQIGQDIVKAQTEYAWGDKVLQQIAIDLKAAFPGVEGFSRTNLYRMRAFFLAYRDNPEIVPQLAGQIPWMHNAILLEKLKTIEERVWYAKKILEYGWSRSILELQISSKLHEREGKAVTNFASTLPPLQSDLASQILKDPYNFDFLTLGADAHERALESGLLEHLKSFMLELGVGFALVGSQYHLEIGGQDFYIDLLFYHLKLRAFVVIELKARDFEAADVGQVLGYVGAVDDLLRHAQDAPTIGLILCKGKNGIIAEYVLRGVSAPIGIADFTTQLPTNLETDLPTIAQLEAELARLDNVKEVRKTRAEKP
jgi:predicted nuclease of restriction endonuclease-like (RecB) superfamily